MKATILAAALAATIAIPAKADTCEQLLIHVNANMTEFGILLEAYVGAQKVYGRALKADDAALEIDARERKDSAKLTLKRSIVRQLALLDTMDERHCYSDPGALTKNKADMEGALSLLK